jgi:hypothetical protein
MQKKAHRSYSWLVVSAVVLVAAALTISILSLPTTTATAHSCGSWGKKSKCGDCDATVDKGIHTHSYNGQLECRSPDPPTAGGAAGGPPPNSGDPGGPSQLTALASSPLNWILLGLLLTVLGGAAIVRRTGGATSHAPS